LNTATLNTIAGPTAFITFNGQRITNLGVPTTGTDAVTKNYVDVALVDKYSTTVALNNITIPSGSLNLNNFKIINLGDAT
jgi:hypothetical protein